MKSRQWSALLAVAATLGLIAPYAAGTGLRTDEVSLAAGSGRHSSAGSTDQGGENCASATIIPSLPYTDSGTTVGYSDDYDETCPYPGSGAPDVVYSYTPFSLQLATFSLCAGPTDYDTKLYIYEESCDGAAIACNDDACSSPQYSNWVSRLNCVQLSAGVTYYIVVDGYGAASGNYTLNADECFGCPIECPPGAIMENEPECADNYEDHDNGGCGSDPVAWDTLECGQTVCATTGTFLVQGMQYRDTDWYLLDLAVASDLTWTVHGNYNIQVVILRAGDPDPCVNYEILGFSSGQCLVALTMDGLEPGRYFLWTGPSEFTGVACGTIYWGEVACTPLQPPNGQCCYATGCADTTQAACDLLDGTWTAGASCSENTCLYAISDLVVTASGADIVLNWSAVPAATFYQVFTSPTSAEPWTLLDATTETTYVHSGILNLENSLFYHVIAAAGE